MRKQQHAQRFHQAGGVDVDLQLRDLGEAACKQQDKLGPQASKSAYQTLACINTRVVSCAGYTGWWWGQGFVYEDLQSNCRLVNQVCWVQEEGQTGAEWKVQCSASTFKVAYGFHRKQVIQVSGLQMRRRS